MCNQGVYIEFICYIGMHDESLTLAQCMGNLAALDMSLVKSELGSGSSLSATIMCQIGQWSARKLVGLVQLAWQKMMAYHAITVARQVIALPIALVVT